MKRITLTLIALLVLCTFSQAQGTLKPWAKPDTERHLYILGSVPHQFTAGGEKHLGYPVKKYSRTKGVVQWIGGKIFRWRDASGQGLIYHAAPDDQGFIFERPLQLWVCEEGACKGWVFVKPPFVGVQVQPPAPAPAPTPPAPMPPPAPEDPPATVPAPPQVLETTYRKAIYRPARRR